MHTKYLTRDASNGITETAAASAAAETETEMAQCIHNYVDNDIIAKFVVNPRIYYYLLVCANSIFGTVRQSRCEFIHNKYVWEFNLFDELQILVLHISLLIYGTRFSHPENGGKKSLVKLYEKTLRV